MRHKPRNVPAVSHNGAWCTSTTIGFGITLYAYFVREAATPAGFVWGIGHAAGQGRKSRFEVLGSFVCEWARRQGVRTAINKAIGEHYDVITTQNGSADGGLAFLRASGYVLDPVSGVWALPIKKARGR